MNAHCESLDIWCYESISAHNFKDSKSIDFNQIEDKQLESISKLTESSLISKSSIYEIDNVSNYESPLKCFRGYRFSSHFTKCNQLEEAYSKFYCNTIDPRRPFCPFDLHGSCKDSNCIYQHLNSMTMDNLQRTEHLLSYCPQLLGLSSLNPTQKEAIKKLSKFKKKLFF